MSTHTLADALLRAVPFRRRIVSLAAVLPPALRGRASYRMSAALARRTELPPMLETNMGIYAGLRCRIPPASHVVVFGKPDLYHGERGPLALAAELCRHADAFVDIGAHLGYFSIFVRAHCGPELPIYFFEADETLFQAVQDNVTRNRLPRITGFHAYYINDYVLEHSPLGDFRDVPAQYNWLFCRRDPHELAALLVGSRLTVA